MACQHIGVVRPQHIRICVDCAGVVLPFFLRCKRSHVVANTADFFLGQSVELRQQHNGLLPVTFQKCVGVVVRPNNLTVPEVEILVNLAEVVEHTHNVWGTLFAPDQTTALTQADKVTGNTERMVEQAAFVVAVVLG